MAVGSPDRHSLSVTRFLSVADVERQPFRSMGFVSVIIVSALFALGLLWPLHTAVYLVR